MIEATVAGVRALGADAAVLLATPTTYATGIYEGYGVELTIPPAEVRAELGPLIAQAVEGTAAGGGGARARRRARTPAGSCR